MSSLRASIATLQRYARSDTIVVDSVAQYLRMERPYTVSALMDRIAALPDSITLHQTINTGTALRGEVTVTLHRDGRYRFSGFMRATGIPSFSFRVGAVVRSANGQAAIALQRSGEVFGTDTPGHRQHDWDESGLRARDARFIRELWPDLSTATLSVTRSSEVSGLLGTASTVIVDLVKFLVVAETFGGALAVCALIGEELGQAGVDLPGLGGVVGVAIVGGALIIWGPLALGPAILLGVAAGAIVDALVKIRPLRAFEEAFARQVFGNSLDFTKIRITNMLGIGSRGFTMPTLDDHILLNIGTSDAMFTSPTTATSASYPMPGQLLIHELVHAWQIQHATALQGFVPGWICEGLIEQEGVGRNAYTYGPPTATWGSMHNEAQAHLVDDWFAGTGRVASETVTTAQSGPRPMDPGNPYFGYIENNLQAGVM